VRIQHLALTVRDPQASARFYLGTLGLAARAGEEPWGVRVSTDDDFMVALIRGAPLSSEVVDRVHFGCRLASPDAVHAARERLRGAEVHEVEWCDEDGYTAVKVADPDGYVVELSYEDVSG